MVVWAASVRVTNKEKSSTLCRPIQHLYPLEVRSTQEEEAIQEDTVDPELTCQVIQIESLFRSALDEPLQIEVMTEFLLKQHKTDHERTMYEQVIVYSCDWYLKANWASYC